MASSHTYCQAASRAHKTCNRMKVFCSAGTVLVDGDADNDVCRNSRRLCPCNDSLDESSANDVIDGMSSLQKKTTVLFLNI